jgi:translocation and assembly module TamB
MKTLRRILLWLFAVLLMLAVILSITGILVLRSNWFRERVRARIVSEIEKATGGRAELGRFDFDWTGLNATVTSLSLHGREAASEPPLLRVDSVVLQLRVISALERKVDLVSLRVVKPQIKIIFYPDGTTNIPGAGNTGPSRKWPDQLLDLAVRRYELVDGMMEYDDRKTPVNLRGEHLALQLNYEAAGPAYTGTLKTSNLRTQLNGLRPVLGIDAAVDAAFRLESTRVVFSKLTITSRDSRADLVGSLEDLEVPHGKFEMKASASIRDAVQLFDVPLKPVGSVAFNGTLDVDFKDPIRFSMEGRGSAKGVGYKQDRIDLNGAEAAGDVILNLDGLTVTNLSAKAMDSTLKGKLSLADWRKLHLEGTVDSLEIASVNSMAGGRPLPWGGSLSGTVRLDNTIGKKDMVAQAVLAILPAAEGNPIDGMLDVHFDQAKEKIALGESRLHTNNSTLTVSGTLGEELHAKFHSTDLDDVLPALRFLDETAPRELPLKLKGGAADGEGDVTGSLDDLEFEGDVHVGLAEFEGHAFDRFEGHLETTKTFVKLERALLSRGNMQVSGDARVTARQGKFEDGALSGSLALRGFVLEEVLKEAKISAPISGMLTGSVKLAGTVQDPQGSGDFDIRQPVVERQSFDRLRASVRMSPGLVELTAGEADWAPARVLFSGALAHSAQNWQTGDLRVQLTAQDIALDRLQALQKFKPPLAGVLQGTLEAAVHVQDSSVTVSSANGKFSAANLTVDKQPVGSISLTAQTRNDNVELSLSGKMRESNIQGTGSFRIDSDMPGSVEVRFSQLDVETAHQLAMLGGTPEKEASPLPFEGSVEGSAKATLPLRSLQGFQAELTLSSVQLRPKPSATPRSAAAAKNPAADIELHNTKPMLVALNSKGATIRSAEFAGRDTTIQATGSLPFTEGEGADLTVHGDLNLVILKLLSPDLQATGTATMQAAVRGALRDPSVSGRMELKHASLEFEGLPNSLDNAEGVVLFDRNRATIQQLTAETGGGKLSLSGFVEFGSSIIYRLQADARQVRVRWPEDVSNTFDAKLALNGTPDSSTLSGTLTIERTSFDTRADLGQLLANSAQPVPTIGQPNDVLRGLQFDVRIESGPNFQFQTSMTRDVEADITLRLRGTPLRPVLLGDISVNQGEIQVLGNRYTVNRGDIHFLNPVKIDPTLDMELETKARGVTVNIKFSGTMEKFNTNFSSDPPLQSNEIIALLAVGRDPTLSSGLSVNTPAGGSGGFGAAGLGLLGEAASEQFSSRVQRFIGSSRVKIDPTLTGIDNLPQARLTIEQPVSRDITLTYITNLNRTQEQIVRIQWDFNRSWSAIAVRDSNGSFGLDFQFRKRF